MLFVFVGQDIPAKEAELGKIRSKLLPSSDAAQFDYEVLHAPQLSPEELKKSLVALPAIAERRLVVVRDCFALSAQNRDILLGFLDGKPGHCVLVLDALRVNPKDTFFRQLARLGKIREFGVGREINAFALTDAIAGRQQAEALRILNDLLRQGEHPLKILGAVVWSWGHNRQRMAFERFESGLRCLQEADLNIKRSRLRPDYALEMLVVKLCQ